MNKERRLGRGLEALLGRIPGPQRRTGIFACSSGAARRAGPIGGRSPRRHRRRPCSGLTPRTPRPAS